MSGNCEHAAIRHSLNAIDHDVQKCLLHQIRIHFHGARRLVHVPLYGDAVLLGIGARQQGDIVQQPPQVHLFQMQVTRPGEIHQRLDDTIQPANLAVDDVDVPARVRFLLG